MFNSVSRLGKKSRSFWFVPNWAELAWIGVKSGPNADGEFPSLNNPSGATGGLFIDSREALLESAHSL
jgi:hypothetical protein